MDDGQAQNAHSVTAANRTGWNLIAADRGARGPEFFRGGGSTLDDFETDLLGDVRARDLLHLACANGNDSLSWAVRGARVTGVDISEVATGIAQRTAEQAGLDARFLAADVCQLPPDLGRFDIVYMSWGAICWMPDLDRWARIVHDHLGPGGFLALFEHHPVWEVLAVRDGQLALINDYFGRAPVRQTEAAKQPSGARAGADMTSFIWPVSDVLASLNGAGLRIDHFSEGTVPGMYAGLGACESWLPAYYAVIAARPG